MPAQKYQYNLVFFHDDSEGICNASTALDLIRQLITATLPPQSSAAIHLKRIIDSCSDEAIELDDDHHWLDQTDACPQCNERGGTMWYGGCLWHDHCYKEFRDEYEEIYDD